ncbi:hypothetical protein [Iningainema tapete]|uniref:Uncharacterized protein n=1 Tax=Iningainema tapete BLCC-T55 TaxID=2748662 RepID=A0A8J7C9R0_9CYAN|nr:hypothetical protein [Iningainema tapete]MBD2771150.1 hypothetical protein [Iningainema tapete BLCC-T55]
MEDWQVFCTQWQQRLKLQDWDVNVKIVSLREMGESLSGSVTYNIGKKIADIKLIKPEDYPCDSMRPQDMEETLVHELLHLHFAPLGIENDTPEQLAEEQAINALAKALIQFKRSTTPMENFPEG